MLVVADIETNGLVDPDKLWCVVLREVRNPDNVHTFERPDLNPTPLVEFGSRVTGWIGHNFLSFDFIQLGRLVPKLHIDPTTIIDTLVISRLLNYNRAGGHSIAKLAEGLGERKVGKEIEDWTVYAPLMLERCINDTLVSLKVYQSQLKYIKMPEFKQALRTEHDLELLTNTLTSNGFPFLVDQANLLLKRLEDMKEPLDTVIQEAFPPRLVQVGTVTPRLTKHGTLHAIDLKRLVAKGYKVEDVRAGETYPIYEEEVFNPASPKQMVERLNEAGWKPTEKTKGHIECEKMINSRHWRGGREKQTNTSLDLDTLQNKLENYRLIGWKVSEENLTTLPSDAPLGARKLAERVMLESRISDVKEWLALARPSADGLYRIHGNFMGIGAWTHRMSHQGPNMANIPVPKKKDDEIEFERMIREINHDMRELWYAPKGSRMIGTDADGIQMRIFAHYVNDPKMIEAIVSGRKEDGTDIHSVHRRALGEDICKSRDDAKTFIYAWLLGAAIPKLANVLRCSLSEGKKANQGFVNLYPGLQELKKKRIPSDANRGYFVGLDGRLVACPDEHRVLAGYLQNGEKIIMARACLEWNRRLKAEKVPFTFVNFVHDEWQTLVPDDDEIANYVAKVQQEAIENQAQQLNLNLPLAANSAFGYSWAETH